MTGQTGEQIVSEIGTFDTAIVLPTEGATRKVTSPSWSPIATVLIAAACILFGIQIASLYTTPRPDCDRWHGDETWLMREFQTQMTEGVMRYPEALDATIGIRNTFPISSMWLNAAVYGLPARAFFPTFDLITIGRTVTAILAGLLLLTMYLIGRRFGASSEIISLLILLLVSSRTFLLASHSARYDIWVGLGVVLFWYITEKFRVSHHANTKWITVGLMLPLMLLWNAHTLRIAAVLVPILILQSSANWKEILKRSAIAFASSVTGFAVQTLLYHHFNGVYFGEAQIASHSQFDQVTQNIPLLHPFSPQLQFANLHARLAQFASEAPLPLIVILLALVAILTVRDRDLRNFSLTAMAMAIAWAITLRPLPYYDLHILPMLLIGSAVILTRATRGFSSKVIGGICIIVGVLAAGVAVRDLRVATTNGERISSSVQVAARQIQSDLAVQGSKPTVLAEVPLINSMLSNPGINFISPYFLIFPAVNKTPVEFLYRHSLQYVVVEGSHLRLPSGFALGAVGFDADSSGALVQRYLGTFNDNHRDYFRPWPERLDTISLYRVLSK